MLSEYLCLGIFREAAEHPEVLSTHEQHRSENVIVLTHR